jgi:hypothetical protein
VRGGCAIALCLSVACGPTAASPEAPRSQAPEGVGLSEPAQPLPEKTAKAPQPPEPQPEYFGAPFAEGITPVSLSALIADPAPHEGRIVETEGAVSQVCQAAGCWMELTDAASGERVRTPMAGHAFFLPKTVVGKRARVQARVELIALSAAAKQHLEAEGASATSSKLSLSALAVLVQ